MKRKLGPLPVWAWVLIAGGTVGIIWYLRSGSGGSSSPAATDGSLPATAGAPPDAGSAGGGGGTTDTGSGNDAIWAELMNLHAEIAAIPGGGQGLTDGGSDSPTQTWAGELQDVGAGITALHDAFPGLFAQPAATNAGTTNAPTLIRPSKDHGGQLWSYRIGAGGKLIPIDAVGPKPKSPGSGSAGNTGNTGNKPKSPQPKPIKHVAEGKVTKKSHPKPKAKH